MTSSEPQPSSSGRGAPAPAGGPRSLALVGNPNTGKTTLFNALTGGRARVGNYPGITVDRRVGRLLEGDNPPKGLTTNHLDIIDLPGTYSLSARSAEEQITIEELVGVAGHPAPAGVIVVVDAGQLVRNLYLALQVLELEVPAVVALNMIDEVEGERPDVDALADLLGVEVVATSARTGEGVDALRAAIGRLLSAAPPPTPPIDYPAALLADAEALADALPEAWLTNAGDGRRRALALWAMSSVDHDDELVGVPQELRDRCLALLDDERDRDAEIIETRYAFLDAALTPQAEEAAPKRPAPSLTDRVDRVMLHPVLGFAVFVGIMLVLFQALFSWANPAIDAVSDAVAALQGWCTGNLPPGTGTDLLVEGVIGGVGNVIVFLPQIILLFLLMGLLEDSGYMARAAYLMDRLMKAVGLHGRAFVPMMSGCACAIPAIMATRTMERQRDRLLTMLVIPLMTCSARLPVYTLIIAALFPPRQVFGFLPLQSLLMVFMYFFSTITALAAAAAIGRTVVKGRRIPLLLELPPYRLPTLRGVVRQVLDRSKAFLSEAGTVIMACTIVLWALLSHPAPQAPKPLAEKAASTLTVRALAVAGDPVAKASPLIAKGAKPGDNSDALSRYQADKLAGSYGGRMGKAIEPAIRPLGFDWKVGVGIIGAFAAREVFISTMGVVYGIGAEVDEESKPLRERIAAERHGDGKAVYTPLMGLSLMIFFALACQCMSTVAVVKRETRSYRWPLFLFVYMTTLAWVMSFAVYQGGKLLGFA